MPNPNESGKALRQLAAISESLDATGQLPPGVSPGDFPGTPVVLAGRLHGRYAAVTCYGLTLLCFEWEVTLTQDFADGTAHGDFWDVPVPLKMAWTGRVRGYFPNTTAVAISATNHYGVAAFKGSGDPAAGTLAGFSTVTTSGGTTVALFTGSCYASRMGMSAPIGGMFTQELELRGIGAPSVGVTV